MGLLYNIINGFVYKYNEWRSIINEKKKIKDARRVNLLKQVHLTNKQKREIDTFYKQNYGKKIPYKWHRLYTSYTGIFDAQYIPELIFIPIIEKKFVHREFEGLADKNLLPLLAKDVEGVKPAHVIISCVNGLFRDSHMNIISFNEAVEILSNAGEVFLKPSIDSNSGKGCSILNVKNSKDILTSNSIEKILVEAGNNFNVQEKILNCKSISALNESSINTFRVTTYIWRGKIFHFPLILRIGRVGKILDNAHQGGLFIGVDDYGTLMDCAYTEFQERFIKHPDSGVVFCGYKIPETAKILNAAYQLHSKIPQVGMISWDLTVDDKGEAVVIELNLTGQAVWISQMAHGKSAFEENTAGILRWIGKNR